MKRTSKENSTFFKPVISNNNETLIAENYLIALKNLHSAVTSHSKLGRSFNANYKLRRKHFIYFYSKLGEQIEKQSENKLKDGLIKLYNEIASINKTIEGFKKTNGEILENSQNYEPSLTAIKNLIKADNFNEEYFKQQFGQFQDYISSQKDTLSTKIVRKYPSAQDQQKIICQYLITMYESVEAQHQKETEKHKNRELHFKKLIKEFSDSLINSPSVNIIEVLAQANNPDNAFIDSGILNNAFLTPESTHYKPALDDLTTFVSKLPTNKVNDYVKNALILFFHYLNNGDNKIKPVAHNLLQIKNLKELIRIDLSTNTASDTSSPKHTKFLYKLNDDIVIDDRGGTLRSSAANSSDSLASSPTNIYSNSQ